MDDLILPDTLKRLDVHLTVDPTCIEAGRDDARAQGVHCSGDTAPLSPPPTSHSALAAPPTSEPEAGAPDWMSRLGDDVLLSDLSIPGTHDSCARTNIPYVRTQSLSVARQLHLGVRALDLRLRRDARDGHLYCFHGGVPLGPSLRPLPLAAVMADVWAFLESTGRSETVLVSVDNDDIADGRDPDGRAAFYAAMADFVASTPPWPWPAPSGDDGTPPATSPRWFAEPRTPRLCDVRGRAVLLRRFAAPQEPVDIPQPALPLGLDLSAWVNDSADFTIVTPHGRFRVQDKWFYADRIALRDLVASKGDYVRAMLDRAAADDDESPGRRPHEGACSRWFINFCSAVGQPYLHAEVAEPRAVAVGAYTDWGRTWVEGINVETVKYIRQQPIAPRRRLGIVYMDFPELPKHNGLVAQLISTNF